MLFTNSYAKLPEYFYERIKPELFESPELLCLNTDLSQSIGLKLEAYSTKTLAKIFSGQQLLEGMEPLAQAYAGHQFGHPVGQLGDGRAHLLAEIKGYDIQLKGSGKTRFSRNGDGRYALGPALREYLVSEAMHALGVPTTRALACVVTNEEVYRQFGNEPGAILTRLADSCVRVGTFQYFLFKQDIDSIERLLEYTLARHYPHLVSINEKSEQALAFIEAVSTKQAELVAKWMGFGFVHGVMNTDNCAISGITLDYGPCAFLDEFKFDKVFSSIDAHGRYAYSNQASMAMWNMARLAECLLPLIHQDSKKAIEKLSVCFESIETAFKKTYVNVFAEKLALPKHFVDEDPKYCETVINLFLRYLEKEELDFTLSFRYLPDLFNDKTLAFFPKTKDLEAFLASWKPDLTCLKSLNTVNPLYIPRNHFIQRVIKQAYTSDFNLFDNFLKVLKTPFQAHDTLDYFKQPPKPQERISETFCGT